ncbi:hypothetical protein GWI33_005422 [Rhynchophorus ferrugineus]|uniref:Uncharacterized protein n=1 Tax=Rhynchophorus ferrugineus TaxID=354439 RepID=A0A834IVZ2_RHYFE|nr:hypothetical protein GWI33_005422 [Rhynchophorus ferrugineus]
MAHRKIEFCPPQNPNPNDRLSGSLGAKLGSTDGIPSRQLEMPTTLEQLVQPEQLNLLIDYLKTIDLLQHL